MKLQAYKKSIEVWMENNKDMSEAARYQDVIESLKMNKDIEGLAKYIGEHVVGKLDTIEKQNVKEIIELLDLKYGRTRLEELEELMEDWIKFNFNEHESEEEYLFAQEKMITRQEEKQVTLKEWNTIWMMYGAKQRKGIENYQLLELRKVIKADSTEVQKGFVKKYKELKIESNRGKQAPCANTYLMRETAKERNINWCEEYKLNKIILVNYTERGKQLINIGLRNKYQKQGGQINVKGRENPLTGVIKIGAVQY